MPAMEEVAVNSDIPSCLLHSFGHCACGVRIIMGVGGIRVSGETLIKSLQPFILEFLCNPGNMMTRIAGCLRISLTKWCIKILIKAYSANESVLFWYSGHLERNPGGSL